MKTSLTVLLLFFLNSYVYCQNSTLSGSADGPGTNLAHSGPSLIPASPEAYNFTKYGNLPVGLFTGTAQFSIPIYNLGSGNLTHAISLDYATNGIKVDEIASRVGLGWTLRAGGTITRNVQGLPDEFSNRTFYHKQPTSDNDFWNYVRQAGYASPPDFQPDEYSFNVNGLSGKFIKREDGSFRILTANGIRVDQDNYSLNFTLTGTDGTKYYFNQKEYTKSLSQVEATAPLNEPGFIVTAWQLTKIVSQEQDSIVFNYTPFADTIKYFNGISQENSLYIPIDYTYRTSRLNEMSVLSNDALGPACLDPDCLYLTTNPQVSASLSSYLSSISFNNGRIDIITSAREDVLGERKIDSIKVLRTRDMALIKCFVFKYIYSYNGSTTYSHAWTTEDLRKRLYLEQFHEVSSDLILSNKYLFGYDDINSLPPRLSFAQDHFGYFNGKVNSYFFPNDTWVDQWLGGSGFGGDRKYDFNYAKKGVLTTITYPTGGYSNIEYEPHKVKNLIAYKSNIDPLLLRISSTSSNMNLSFYTDTFHVVPGRSLRLNVKCDWATSPAVYLPESYYAVCSVIDESNNNCATLCEFPVYPGSQKIDYQLQEHLAQYNSTGGVYRLKVYATQANLKIFATVDKITQTIDTSRNVGIAGIRVKTVTDYIEVGNERNRREFLYGEWTDAAQQYTSGEGIIIDPSNRNFVSVARRFADHTSAGSAGSKITFAGNTILHSNSVRNVFYNESGSVVYSKVIELNHASDNQNIGGTEYEFIAQEKSSALPLSNTMPTYVWSFSPFQAEGFPQNNDDFKNGLLKSSKVFTYQEKFGTRKILKEINNYYSEDNQYKTVDTFYLVRQVMKRDGYATAWAYFADYDINRYFRYYNWIKLDSTIEINHSDNSELVNKMRYAYSSSNFKVSYAHQQSSDGSIKTSFKKYPGDVLYGQSNFYTYSGMTQRNIIDPVIEETLLKNYSTELSRKESQFGPLTYLGNTIFLPTVLKSSLFGQDLQTDLTFEQYDSKGHPLQYTTKDGITTSVIWGYNNTYPVAKIVGSTYSAAIALLNTSVLEVPSSDEAMRNELNKLRNELVGKFFVTTYTYTPLIGMTSQTDPNNRTTYYEYDGFGRLSLIRDQDQNILKKYCYNYAGQPESCPLGIGNAQKSGTFTKQCGSGFVGSQVTYTVQANTYFAATQPEADALAQADVDSKGQAYANSSPTATCTPVAPTVYYSQAINSNYYSQNCATGQTPVAYPVSIAYGAYTSTVSPEAANQLAQQAAQSQANQYGTCTSAAQTIYARIEVENYQESSWDDTYNDGSRYTGFIKNGDVVVKFYSDAACTQALTLTAPLTVYMSTDGFMETSTNYFTNPSTESYSIPAGVDKYVFTGISSLGGQDYWYDSDGNLADYEYWRDYYHLSANGTQYVIVQPNQVPATW